MFTPVLGLEVLNKATTLRFTDETGPDTGAGTKWDGIGGILSFNVSCCNTNSNRSKWISISYRCMTRIIAASPSN